MPDKACVEGAKHAADIEHLKRDTADQWLAIGQNRDEIHEVRKHCDENMRMATEKYEQALREIAQRLPNWAVVIATAVSGVSGAIIGTLATLLAMK